MRNHKGKHLSGPMLRAVLEGDRSILEVGGLLLRHVVELCDECAAALQEAIGERALWPSAAQLTSLQSRWESDVAEAERELEMLLELPREQRRGRVDRARKRFRNPVLAVRLVELAREATVTDASHAFHLAELAEMVSLRLSFPTYPRGLARDLVIRSRGAQGNAARVGGDLLTADQLLQSALTLSEETADPLVRAEALSLYASLCRDRRYLDECQGWLAAAERLYRSAGDPTGAARCAVQSADAAYYNGDPETALERITRTLDEITPEHGRLYLVAVNNRAAYLVELERLDQARSLLDAHADLFLRADRSCQLAVAWLEARIASGSGDEPAAETALLELREIYMREQRNHYAAMVTLDLILLWARQGRISEVREAAADLFVVLDAVGVHREALAALALFRQAVEAGEITVAVVARLSRELRAARPGVLLAQPS